MTYQIIYSSVASTPMGSGDLEELLAQAQGNNSKKEITGALVYSDRFFLQILEGEIGTVQNLMDKISMDIRHDVVTILQAGEKPSPAFSDWNMAYVGATPDEVAKWAGLGPTTQLPDIFSDMQQNPQRAMLVTNSILALLSGDFSPQPKSTEQGESSPGELPPQALAEPYVKLSPHTAPSVQSPEQSGDLLAPKAPPPKSWPGQG